jgi:hypothetical protein
MLSGRHPEKNVDNVHNDVDNVHNLAYFKLRENHNFKNLVRKP